MTKYIGITSVILVLYSLFSCNQMKNNVKSENIRIVKQFFEDGHNSQNPDIADKIIAQAQEEKDK